MKAEKEVLSISKKEETPKKDVVKVVGCIEQDRYSKTFEDWWDIYPRKVGKGEAYKKYNTRLKDGWSPNELLEAAKNYRNDVQRTHTEKCYIKHPKTFLSDTLPFTDFIKRTDKESTVDTAESNENPYAAWEG